RVFIDSFWSYPSLNLKERHSRKQATRLIHSPRAAPWPLLAALVLTRISGFSQAQENTLTNEWALPIGVHSDSSPAVSANGTIYFGDFEGKLWAVTAEGKRKWSFLTGLEIRSSPAIGANGTIYFGSRDRKFYALNAEGTKQWAFDTG